MVKLGEAAQCLRSPEGGQKRHLQRSSLTHLTWSGLQVCLISTLLSVSPKKSACCGRTHFIRCLRFDWSHILWGKCYVIIMNRKQSTFHFKEQLFVSHKRNAVLMNVILWRCSWVASWNFIVKFSISASQKFYWHCELSRSYTSFFHSEQLKPELWNLILKAMCVSQINEKIATDHVPYE